MCSPISTFKLGKIIGLTGEEKSDRMKLAALAVAVIIVLILLVGCGVAPEETTVMEATEVADTTTSAVKTYPLFITSAGHTLGAWQASPSHGRPIIDSYEAQPLPNGQVAIKFKSDACHLFSNTALIVSSGDVSTIWPASSTEGQSVVGRYETQPLPNGEMAIKLQKANGVGKIDCP
ncbi:MAG: hypothetical protein KDI79_24325 [Anaerolineae bacterium]|nr:hypothetical protein [Anaerolineae bacterium]